MVRPTPRSRLARHRETSRVPGDGAEYPELVPETCPGRLNESPPPIPRSSHADLMTRPNSFDAPPHRAARLSYAEMVRLDTHTVTRSVARKTIWSCVAATSKLFVITSKKESTTVYDAYVRKLQLHESKTNLPELWSCLRTLITLDWRLSVHHIQSSRA